MLFAHGITAVALRSFCSVRAVTAALAILVPHTVNAAAGLWLAAVRHVPVLIVMTHQAVLPDRQDHG